MRLILFLLGSVLFIGLQVQAQDTITISLAPVLGFDVNMSTLAPADRFQRYAVLSHGIPIKTPHAGFGMQVGLPKKWQITLGFAASSIGSGFKTKQIEAPGGIIGISRSGNTSYMPQWSIKAEKTFYTIKMLTKRESDLKLAFQAGAGITYHFIPHNRQADTLIPLVSISTAPIEYEDNHAYQLRKSATSIALGLNCQVRSSRSSFLKIGVWYEYTPAPAYVYTTRLSSPFLGTDNFKRLCTQQNFLFFIECPIRILRFIN